MSEPQQLERIFNELAEVRKDQVAQGKVLVRIETNLTNHVAASGPIREQVAGHERSIQRLRGAGWLLGVLWALLLGLIGLFSKHGAAAAK